MPAIPEWLTLLLTYTGTGGITSCVMNMREATRAKYSVLLLVLLWPLFLFLPLRTAWRKLRGPSTTQRLAEEFTAREQRRNDIEYWRKQFASDSPVEQELAREMLTQYFEVPEKDGFTMLVEAADRVSYAAGFTTHPTHLK